VVVGDCVNMAGGVGVHHFVTVGEYAFVGGLSRIHHDVPPFCKVDGADLVRGLNVVGLRRAGFSEDDIEALESACRRLFYHDTPFAIAMAEFDTMNGLNPKVKQMIEFLRRRDAGKHGRYLESLRK
jgi:UDP-N-acetylglucosamine acyltransferase